MSQPAQNQQQHHRIAKPVVHESLYVYATDKANGGMALAEKWRLTLVQQAGSNRQRKSVNRTSMLTGVDTLVGLVPDIDTTTTPFTMSPTKSGISSSL